MEQDIADRFGISQSTVSRITLTWINFLYLCFKVVNLWPSKDIITLSFMPKVYRDQYPTTRVVIDETEIYVEQSRLPELQQMTFQSPTCSSLSLDSPSGAITLFQSPTCSRLSLDSPSGAITLFWFHI